MICTYCKEDLGEGDEYDLLKGHINSCNGKIARDYRVSRDNSEGHGDYCTCEYCI